MNNETKELVVKEQSLSDLVRIETENRKILTQFITDHMKEGTDYGKIQIGGKLSKPSLFKAGAEKFASLMNFRADITKDDDTWEMAGRKEGLFCYKAIIYSKQGIVGMGLGACSLEEKKSYNNAIKIAKKRAFVDAILTTGALSDFFTQDLEDMDNHSQKPQTYPSRPLTEAQGGSVIENSIKPISMNQKELIISLLGKKGKTIIDMQGYLKEKFDKDSHQLLTLGEASILIKKLMSMPDKSETPLEAAIGEEQIDMEEVDDGIKQMRLSK